MRGGGGEDCTDFVGGYVNKCAYENAYKNMYKKNDAWFVAKASFFGFGWSENLLVLAAS